MDEHKYKVRDLYERNHFRHRKINGEWHYWRDSKNRSEEMLPALNRKATSMGPNEDMAACNPKYSKGGVYKKNCISCALAYDLRRRGYDVEAASINTTSVTNGSLPVQLGFYKGEKLEMFEVPNDPDVAAKQFTNQILKYGDGSRGMLRIRWKNGDGHAVVWEINDRTVVVRDPQNNTMVDFPDYVRRAKTFYYFRTDNLEPTEKTLRFVKNRISEEGDINDSQTV